MAFPEWVQAQDNKLSAMETLFEAIIAEGDVECDHCGSSDVHAIIVTAGGATPVCENCS